jgi:hypothetical protein
VLIRSVSPHDEVFKLQFFRVSRAVVLHSCRQYSYLSPALNLMLLVFRVRQR